MVTPHVVPPGDRHAPAASKRAMSRTKRRTLIAIALVAFASAAVALIAFGSLWAFGALLALGIAALSPMADGQPPVLWWRRR